MNNMQVRPRRVVIKIGTSTLTGGSDRISRENMLELTRAVVQLMRGGIEVVLISSGAIAAGREALGLSERPRTMSTKQMLASVGQGRLIKMWEDLFEIYGFRVGQLLLTRADLEDRHRYLNAHDTLFALLNHGIIPVINENDAVSTSEIKVGDNDNLAALTAVMCEADLVILLTDQKGLYRADPRLDPKAELIPSVAVIDDEICALAGGSGTSLGTGGMATKIAAARTTTSAGIALIIASGADPAQIPDLCRGGGVGTYFCPQSKPMQKRQSWLSTAVRTQGSVTVDDGAVRALRTHGSSLLPSGILEISGEFLPGSLIEILDVEGKGVGRGIARYSSDELIRIARHRSSEIANILGSCRSEVAIHRDDLVLEN